MQAPHALVAGLALVALPVVAGAGSNGHLLASKHNLGISVGTYYSSDDNESGACGVCHVPSLLVRKRPRLAWQPSARDARLTILSPRRVRGGLPEVTGSTLRCLGCHDGSVAVGSVYRPMAVGIEPMTRRGRGNDAVDRTLAGEAVLEPRGFHENHPVSVPYRFQNAPSSYQGLQTGRFGPTNLEWVSDPRRRGLRLFGDDGRSKEPVPGSAGIECASCHDPHGTGNPFFLRVPKADSRLCLSCHAK